MAAVLYEMNFRQHLDEAIKLFGLSSSLFVLSLGIVTTVAQTSRIISPFSMSARKYGLRFELFVIASPAQSQGIMLALSVHTTRVLFMLLSYIFGVYLRNQSSNFETWLYYVVFEFDLFFCHIHSFLHLLDHNSILIICEVETRHELIWSSPGFNSCR